MAGQASSGETKDAVLRQSLSTQHPSSAHARKVIIIGGIPAPIGGVTTYLRRLLHRDTERTEALIDFYPGMKEPVRADCQHKIVELGGKVALVRWLWAHRASQVDRELFFNFSTPRALMLTLLVPKVAGSRWSLMLHHGTLTADRFLFRFLVKVALARFDEIRSLSAGQAAFYEALNVTPGRVVAGSSYCEPADHVDDPEAVEALSRIRGDFGKVIVMSGFPRSLYNFDLGIETVEALGRTDCALCLFLYGSGELRERLMSLAAERPWVFVFDGRSERYFNTFLRDCDLLLRLTRTESFGISVWDASYWGRKIVATDVCERPETCHKVNLESAKSASIVHQTKLLILRATI